jgi:hypothetical protein
MGEWRSPEALCLTLLNKFCDAPVKGSSTGWLGKFWFCLVQAAAIFINGRLGKGNKLRVYRRILKN